MKKSGIILTRLTKAVAFIIRNVIRLRYRVSVKGLEALSTNKSILFLPNHQALIDPIILISNIYRHKTVLPAISSKYYDFVLLKPFFSNWGAIRVNDLENGNRDVHVLKNLSRAILKGLKRGKSVVLYPGGQISGSGYERIFNKKSAHLLVSKLPENSVVIGVRIRGLWGSMWSKYKSGKSPDFATQFLKGSFYLLVNFIFFIPRRQVEIEFADITKSSIEYARTGKKEFNQFLEDFYNAKGENPLTLTPYFFIQKKNSSK